MDILIKQITMEEMLRFHKLREVHGYCKHCSNHEKNYSCPSFDFTVGGYLKPYNYGTIIVTSLPIAFIDVNVSEEDKSYDSRVYDNYMKENDGSEKDIYSKIAMYYFDEVKNKISHELLKAEKSFASSIGLPPGSCTYCETCYKQKAQPCPHPNKLRYSLEALGFKVSDIYEALFDMKLEWVKGSLPKAFHTCSALLSEEAIDIELLEQQLRHLYV